jgi:hypothetical protein
MNPVACGSLLLALKTVQTKQTEQTDHTPPKNLHKGSIDSTVTREKEELFVSDMA